VLAGVVPTAADLKRAEQAAHGLVQFMRLLVGMDRGVA